MLQLLEEVFGGKNRDAKSDGSGSFSKRHNDLAEWDNFSNDPVDLLPDTQIDLQSRRMPREVTHEKVWGERTIHPDGTVDEEFVATRTTYRFR